MPYYVHFIDDDPIMVYGPYALKAAKDFARIGSIPGKSGGGRRAVTRSKRSNGKIIRIYEQGKRLWPTEEHQLAGFDKAEKPRVLAVRANPPISSAARNELSSTFIELNNQAFRVMKAIQTQEDSAVIRRLVKQMKKLLNDIEKRI